MTWATATGASRDAIYEIRKIPARLGMHDDDLGLVPACLKHFDHAIAPSGYGVVLTSSDLDAARRRGNARIRSLLTRYLASTAPVMASNAGSARRSGIRCSTTSPTGKGFLSRARPGRMEPHGR